MADCSTTNLPKVTAALEEKSHLVVGGEGRNEADADASNWRMRERKKSRK